MERDSALEIMSIMISKIKVYALSLDKMLFTKLITKKKHHFNSFIVKFIKLLIYKFYFI